MQSVHLSENYPLPSMMKLRLLYSFIDQKYHQNTGHTLDLFQTEGNNLNCKNKIKDFR